MKGSAAIKEQNTANASASSSLRERLEEFVWDHLQRFIQSLLEEEVAEFLGRPKAARRAVVDAPPGYRNEFGNPRQFGMMIGVITPTHIVLGDRPKLFPD